MKYVGSTALSQLITLTKTALAGKANSSHTHSAATTGSAGFMSAADKVKLNGLSSGGGATMATKTATLSVAGWSGNAQTVSVSGVTAGNSVIASPEIASRTVYNESGVYCCAQATGTLTFSCEDVPASALTVNILILT